MCLERSLESLEFPRKSSEQLKCWAKSLDSIFVFDQPLELPKKSSEHLNCWAKSLDFIIVFAYPTQVFQGFPR